MGFFGKSEMKEAMQAIETMDRDEVSSGRMEEEQSFSDIDSLFFYALDYASSPDHNWLTNITRGTMKKEKFFQLIQMELKNKTRDEEMIRAACKKLETYIWGYYIIEEYINDDSISDIKILDENHIRLKRNGKRIDADVKFKDEEDYLRFVNIICSRNKISLADTNAIQTFTDAKSNPNARLRFNLTSGILNTTEKPYVHVRKILKKKKTMEELIEAKMVPPELKEYLEEKARTASGIIFTGKGAAGKTTLMNMMLEYIPLDKSGLIIQENDELFSDHPDLMSQHVVTSRDEGHIQYTLKDLATNGLLTDLDYFIIGEIKGDEAAYFMNAAYTGHQCWSSVHGVNSKEAMRKLADYVTYATRYSLRDAYNMLRFMNVIIFMKDFHIQEISEITGINEETGELEYKLVYEYKE